VPQERPVQLRLAREVVVEHGLVDAGAAGDAVHAGAGVAVLGELRRGGGQDALGGRAARALHATNQLVKQGGAAVSRAPARPAAARGPARIARAKDGRMSGMRTVIAGGTGFLGRLLGDALARDGHSVVVLTRNAAARGASGARSVAWTPDGTVGPW